MTLVASISPLVCLASSGKGTISSLPAVVVPDEAIPAVNRRMVEIKRQTFGTPSVEVKSTWLRYPRDRQRRYLDPYGITSETLDAFGLRIMRVFGEFLDTIRIIACVFDKRYYRDRERSDPFCCACQGVLERIQFYMQDLGEWCTLAADQMEDGLSITRGRNGELISVYRNTRQMKHVYVPEYYRVRDVRFRRSRDENLILLADLAAYNVYRQFVEYGVDWDDRSRSSVPMYPYFEALLGNLLRYRGKAVGCGLVKLPDPAHRRWF